MRTLNTEINHGTHPETKQNSRPLSRGICAILQKGQPKDLQEELGIGHKISDLGRELKHMRATWRMLYKLDELDTLLSEMKQSEGRKLIWALKPAMLALIQPKLLEEPCEGVSLLVASCLSSVMRLTAPIPP